MTISFWLGLVTALLNLHPLGEAWKGLGGTLRLVQTRFGIFAPEAAALLMCAGAAFAFDEKAIETAAWATAYSTMVLVWQSAAAGLVIIVIGAVLLAAALWEVGFLIHAAVALAFLPLALVTTVTSGLTLTRAEQVFGFVGSRWELIRQFVPEAYPHQGADKYAAASYGPMAQAGVSGILLAVLLWASALMHLHCASIQMSIGPELWALQAAAEGAAASKRRPLPPHEEGVEVTWGSLLEALLAVGARLTGRKVESHRYSYTFSRPPPTGAAAPGVWNEGAPGSSSSSGISAGAYSEGAVLHDISLGGFGDRSGGREVISTASSQGIESPTAGGGGYAGSVGAPPTPIASRLSALGSTLTPPPGAFRAAAFARLSGASARTKRSKHASSASMRLSSSASATGGFDSPSKATTYGLLSPGGGTFSSTQQQGQGPAFFAGGTAAYFGYLGPQIPEAELEDKVAPIGCADFTRAVSVEGVAAWVAHRTCIVGFAIAAIVALAGLGGGMTVLELKGRCGVLARDSVSVTYAKSFSLADANRNTIYITNNYPFGSIEVAAPHLDSRDNNFTVEVTSYAPSADGLLSFGAFDLSTNISSFSTEGDDDTLHGFEFVHITFSPPPGAETSCQGLRIVLSSVFYANYVIVSKSAFVNVTGDLSEISDGVYTSKTFTSMTVASESAPVLLTNLHVEPADLIEPEAGVPVGLSVTSRSGDVTLTNIFATRPTVRTSGTIRSSNVISTAPLLGCRTEDEDGKIVPAICGDLSYVASGYGRISVSQGLGGDNVELRTEHGEIVATNTAVVAGHDVTVASGTGPIFLTTFIQATGNQTFVSTSGKVSATGAFFNRLSVVTSGDGAVSFIEIFLGLAPPGILVVPNVTASVPLGDPLLYVRTERGDISCLGAGGSAGGSYGGYLSVDMASSLGNINLEVGGGGFVGE